MGISGLYSFVKKNTNCASKIDIVEEINKWTRHNPGKPTIVIDFQAFTHIFTDNPLDSFFGCRSIDCFTKTKQFLTVFQQKGVNLVFFDDGPTSALKEDNVINRQNKRFEEIFNALDKLYECNKVDKLIEKYEIRHHGCLISGIRSIAREFGEFHKTFHNECDNELAAYATKQNAMAVLSNDTDFLIFKGNWNYWSSRDIDLNKLTTLSYNKKDLQHHLNLIEDVMPLFATLAGNDIIHVKLLDRFHRFLGNPRYKFKNISQYIIRYFSNISSYDPEFIARKVFGNTIELAKYTELIRNSLNSYNIDTVVDDIDKNEFLCRIRNIRSDWYSYILDLPSSCTISFFDVRTPQFNKYPTLILEMIQRQMGLILQHKNDKTLTRHIYCYENGQYVYKTLHPEYPLISVPNLDDLYNPDKNDELKMIKLKLLCWILSTRLEIKSIATIEPKYFSACLTLNYMVENMYITIREADIFLHMIETVYKNVSAVIDLPYLKYVDPRAFQILFLYDKVHQNIRNAISNCGLSHLTEFVHMDGLYFHCAYNKMHNMAETEEINAHLGHLRIYAELKTND